MASLDPVVIEFLAKGVPDVSRAFATIERQARSASTAVQRWVASEAQAKERAQARGVRAAETAARHELRAKERAAAQATRVAEKEAKEKERAARRATDASIREAEREHRSLSRLMDQRRRDRDRADRYAHGEAKKAAGAIVAGGARGINTVGRLATGAVRGILSVGGGFSFQDSLARDIRLRGQAANLSEQARIPGRPETVISGSEILGKVKGAALRNVVSEEDTLAGLSAFAGKAGGDNLGVAMKNLDAMAQLSRATGASMEDLGSAMAEVLNADKTQSSEQVLAIMRQLTIQGKLGAVEMKDFADRMAKVSSAASGFGGDKARSIAVMTAFAEEAKDKGGASNPAEAMTAVSAFGATFSKNARLDAFEKFGVAVNDKSGKRRAADDILVDSLLAAEKHGGKGGGGAFDKNFGKMFASVQARRATQGFERVFKEAGGGERGAAAVRAEIERLAGAVLKETEVREAAARRNEEIDAQIQRAMTELHQAVGTQLTPALVRLIPHLVQAVPVFEKLLGGAVKFAEWLERNPLAGIGAIIAAAVGKDVAAAAIGNTVRDILTRSLGGTSVPTGAGAPGAGSGLAGPIAVAGAAAVYEAKVGVTSVLEGQERGQLAVGRLSAMMQSDNPNDRDAAMRAVAEARSYGGLGGAAKLGGALANFGASTFSATALEALGMGPQKNTSADTISKFFESREINGAAQLQATAEQSAILRAQLEATRALGADLRSGGETDRPSRTKSIPDRGAK